MSETLWMNIEVWENGHKYLLRLENVSFTQGYKEIRQLIKKMSLEELDKEHDKEVINYFLWGEHVPYGME